MNLIFAISALAEVSQCFWDSGKKEPPSEERGPQYEIQVVFISDRFEET